MNITLIVAADKNNGIGIAGQIPWHLPNDLKNFKYLTWGLPILMGRKTYESLGKPLPGRKNIVLSNQLTSNNEIYIVKTIEEAIKTAADMDYKELMVIGGGEVYKLFLPLANKIYITRVDAVTESDTFFPAIPAQQFKLISEQTNPADDKHAFAYNYQQWERIH